MMAGAAALICAISFALVMLALCVVMLKLARTLALTNRILNDIRQETLPFMGRIQTTIDHVNDEMGYVDGALKSLEKTAARVNSTARAAQDFVTSPLARALGMGLGAWRSLGISALRKGNGGPEDGDAEE